MLKRQGVTYVYSFWLQRLWLTNLKKNTLFKAFLKIRKFKAFLKISIKLGI